MSRVSARIGSAPAGAAATIYVDSVSGNDSNDGLSAGSPLATLSAALGKTYGAGDTLYLARGGSWSETLDILTSGNFATGFSVDAYGSGALPVVTDAQIEIDGTTISNVDFDQNGGTNRVVRVRADNVTLNNCLVHNAQADGVDVRDGATNTTLNNCEIYFLLRGTFAAPLDAHGIGIRSGSGTSTRSVVVNVNDCIIHEVSGDCIQADPDRLQEADANPETYANYTVTVNVTGGEWYTQPLASNLYGWNAGERPGEDGLDTKANSVRNGEIIVNITDLTAHGWLTANSPHTNPTPFNIKESVTATINRCTLYDNARMVRLRADGEGNPDVTIKNTVMYDGDTGLLVDNGVTNLEVFNNTFGDGITTYLDETGSGIGAGSDLRNNAFLGTKPTAFSDASNKGTAEGVTSADFVDSAANNFRHLASSTDLEEQGVDLSSAGVTVDRLGTSRVAPYSIGAYEVGASSSPHAYYDYLLTAPEGTTLKANHAYRTQAEIDAQANGNPDPGREAVYDATIDGAKWDELASTNSIQIGAKLVTTFGASVTSGKHLIYWESWYGASFGTKANLNSSYTHKAFMVFGFDTDGNNRGIEVRNQYTDATEGKACWTELRFYNANVGGDSTPPETTRFEPNTEEWVRNWLYYDFATGKLSLWIADESNTTPTIVYDDVTVVVTGENTIDGFEYRYNSSSTPGVDWEVGARNHVVLTGVTDLAEAQTIVDETLTYPP